MLSLFADLLIRDIQQIRYTYDPQTEKWVGESRRSNSVRNIATVVRIRIKKKKIKAYIQQWESPARSRSEDDMELIDSKELVFKNKAFRQKLKSLKNDQ